LSAYGDEEFLTTKTRLLVRIQRFAAFRSKRCRSGPFRAMSGLPLIATKLRTSREVWFGRVEDGRGSLGHSATLRFPSPLIEPDVPD
jgi:hypothetical protein